MCVLILDFYKLHIFTKIQSNEKRTQITKCNLTFELLKEVSCKHTHHPKRSVLCFKLGFHSDSSTLLKFLIFLRSRTKSLFLISFIKIRKETEKNGRRCYE